METQQMMELLLARMNASMKEHMQEMKADQENDERNGRQPSEGGRQTRKCWPECENKLNLARQK
jgi:hypothetical protein